MKLRGTKLEEKATCPVVFERPSGAIVFTLSAVLNTSDFDKIYPEPKPPKAIKKGIEFLNIKDPRYVAACEQRAIASTGWLVLETLKATPDLEWEKVKADDPNTWHLWKDELQEAGFSNGEIAYLVNKISEVNGLDEKRLDAARESFLSGQQLLEQVKE